jgi:photosystem II stability/assembly factor-like uncharacterized protein
MSRRLAAALALGLAAAGMAPVPGHAQRVGTPRLTVTPLTLDFPSLLRGVSFTDADRGHAVGSYNSIFRTDDGGATWQRQDTPLPTRPPLRYDTTDATDPTGGAYMAVSFVDADHGYAASSDGAVVATSDGGATWELRPTPAPATVSTAWPENSPPRAWGFQAISFTDRLHGYVVGDLGVILATADGGATWTYQGKPGYGNLRDAHFVDSDHGQIVGIGPGRAGGLRYTTLGTNDAGETWQVSLAGGGPASSADASSADASPTDASPTAVSPTDLTGVAVTTPRHAVAVGNGGRIFVTFDEAKTWRLRRSGTNETLYDVAFADRRRGIAVGGVDFQGDSRAIVLATNDGGESWTAFPQPAFGWFESVTFGSRSTAYAVGCTDRKVDVVDADGVFRPGVSSCDAAAIKIDFPELEAAVEDPTPSGGSPLPLLLLGAAVLLAGAGLVVARLR